MAKKAAKKTVKKKAVKKKTVKKTAKPKSSLKRVSDHKAFFACDGKVLHDLRELAFALGDMHDDSFYHHANSDKNDFASWVEHCFRSKSLAGELHAAKNKHEAQVIVLSHLVRKL